MANHMRMSKVPEFPRPHNESGSIGFGLETAVANTATIVPIITYDEGLGVINSYKSHPQNAAFAEYASSNCYPTSRINSVNAVFNFSMTKEAIETDKIPIIRFYTMTIHTAFDEGAKALDEKSTLDLNEIIELQSETTDRQTFPLYNAIDMKDGKSNALLDMHADQDGLDTDREIEGLAWNMKNYHDCLQYMTNGSKLRSITTPMKEHVLTKEHPYVKIRVNQQSNTKYMNPYAFLGMFILLPIHSDPRSFGKVGDSTDILHMQCDYYYRYLEHNHEFNHSLQ